MLVTALPHYLKAQKNLEFENLGEKYLENLDFQKFKNNLEFLIFFLTFCNRPKKFFFFILKLITYLSHGVGFLNFLFFRASVLYCIYILWFYQFQSLNRVYFLSLNKIKKVYIYWLISIFIKYKLFTFNNELAQKLLLKYVTFIGNFLIRHISFSYSCYSISSRQRLLPKPQIFAQSVILYVANPI